MHDADCLDIIRARDHFDMSCLDFYQEIAANNQQALTDLIQLRQNAVSLIELQGDSRKRTRTSIKKNYEQANGYSNMTHLISAKQHPLLHHLGLEGKLFHEQDFNQLENTPTTDDDTQSAIKENRAYYRGIATPSMLAIRKNKHNETFGELEVRKTCRRLGIPTRSKKGDSENKFGNVNRSTSLLGLGAGVYCGAGFIVIPELDDIQYVFKSDGNTGRGKKRYLTSKIVPKQEKQNQINELIATIEANRVQAIIPTADVKNAYNEVLINIKEFSAVAFTKDPNLANSILKDENYYAYCDATPLLEALYLRQSYYTATGILLPIYEYSGIHNLVEKIELTEEEILKLWIEVCDNFLKSKLEADDNIDDLLALSLDDIKMYAMYGYCGGCIIQNRLFDSGYPADSNYSENLKKKINDGIQEKVIARCNQQIKEYPRLLAEINWGDILTDNVFFIILNAPQALLMDIAPNIRAQLECTNLEKITKIKSINTLSYSLFHIYQYLDLDPILPPEKITRIMYHNDTVKIFTLARLVNHTKTLSHIKDLVTREIKETLSTDAVHIPDWDYPARTKKRERRRQLMRLSIFYDACQEEIDAYVNRRVDSFIARFKREYIGQKFNIFVDELRDNNLLKGFLLKKIKDWYDENQDCINQFPDFEKKYYQYMKKILDAPNRTQNLKDCWNKLSFAVEKKRKFLDPTEEKTNIIEEPICSQQRDPDMLPSFKTISTTPSILKNYLAGWLSETYFSKKIASKNDDMHDLIKRLQPKEKYEVLLNTLIMNIQEKKNNRWTAFNSDEKLNKFKELQQELKRSNEPINADKILQNILEICQMKRNPLHFFHKPHSVEELNKLKEILHIEDHRTASFTRSIF